MTNVCAVCELQYKHKLKADAAVMLLPHKLQDIEVGEDLNIDELATMTAGYSGADIANVCRDAAMMGVRRVMEAARKEGLSGADIQKHMINMRDQLATAVTHDVSSVSVYCTTEFACYDTACILQRACCANDQCAISVSLVPRTEHLVSSATSCACFVVWKSLAV
jgi:SpoVK/Ycf46/Vps4 family AAA+-type ATPase